MNPRNEIAIKLVCFLLIASFSFSYQQEYTDTSEVQWYSMPPDEIKLNTYQSPNKEDPTRRPDYMDWVNYRNAFRYDPDSPPIAKLVDYFKPEDGGYYRDCVGFGGLFIAGSVISFICIIIYLVVRFWKKGCMGPKNKKREEENDCYKWTLIFIGSLISVTSFIVVLVYSSRQ